MLLEDGTEIEADTVISNVNAKVDLPEDGRARRGFQGWALKAIGSYKVSMPCPMIYIGLDTRPPLDAHHTIYPGHVDDLATASGTTTTSTGSDRTGPPG